MPEAPRKRRAPILLIGLAVLVVLLLVPWLLRSTIATSMAKSELGEHGLTCDERFSVDVDSTFSSATVAPSRCEHEGGLVEAIELPEAATVTLSGLAPQMITVPQVNLQLRDQDLRGGSGWGHGRLSSMELEQRLAGLVKGLAELSATHWPDTRVAHVDVVRGGRTNASLRGMRLVSGEQQLDAEIAGAEFPGHSLTLEDVTGTATRSDVMLDGDAELGGILGGILSAGSHFHLTAESLDTNHPSFHLR